jgi:hypothetical protein
MLSRRLYFIFCVFYGLPWESCDEYVKDEKEERSHGKG